MDSARKTARLVHNYQYRLPENPYRVIRDIQPDQVHALSMERLDGTRSAVFVFQMEVHPGTVEVKLWIDPQTKLPTRLVFQNRAWKGRGKFDYDEAVNLAFDQPLDEKLFSTEPPEGYKVEEETLVTAATRRKD